MRPRAPGEVSAGARRPSADALRLQLRASAALAHGAPDPRDARARDPGPLLRAAEPARSGRARIALLHDRFGPGEPCSRAESPASWCRGGRRFPLSTATVVG